MGCLCSRGLSEETNPRTFKVVNVDDRGQDRNPGHIEITETELVWYQRGREPIRWPLNSLRRYGFEEELFSFESGRRCPTGPGIYAFKCRRAQALFNLLQESIQRQSSGQDDTGMVTTTTTNHSTSLVTGNHTHSIPRSSLGVTATTGDGTRGGSARTSRPNSLELTAPAPPITTETLVPNGSPSPLYINGDIHKHEYINTETRPRQNSLADPTAVTAIVPPATEHVIQYAELDLPRGDDAGSTGEVVPNGHGPPDTVLLAAASQQVMYVNIPTNEMKRKAPPPHPGGLTRQFSRDDPPPTSRVVPPASRANNGTKVNYIQLDHGDTTVTTATPTVPTPTAASSSIRAVAGAAAGESPTRTKTDTYARIDIERTRALNQKQTNMDDECERKTRHNSNIDEVYGADTKAEPSEPR